MMEQVIRILSEIKRNVDFANTGALIDDKVIDSLELMELISQLEDEFDVEIGMEEITPENFNSASAIYAMIKRLSE